MKFCKDCKFYQFKWETLHECRHASAIAINLVNGENIFLSCEHMRTAEAWKYPLKGIFYTLVFNCGTDAQFFESEV